MEYLTVPLVITIGVTLLILVSGLLIVFVTITNKLNKSVKISGIGGKGEFTLGKSPEETMRNLQENFVGLDTVNKILIFITSEREKLARRKADFTHMSLRDATTCFWNVMEQLHAKLDSEFRSDIDFFHVYKVYVIEELSKQINTMLIENHLAERKPDTKERTRFIENKIIGMTGILKNVLIEHWVSVANINSTVSIPSKEEIKVFLRDEDINELIHQGIKDPILKIMDDALILDKDKKEQRDYIRTELSEYLKTPSDIEIIMTILEIN